MGPSEVPHFAQGTGLLPNSTAYRDLYSNWSVTTTKALAAVQARGARVRVGLGLGLGLALALGSGLGLGLGLGLRLGLGSGPIRARACPTAPPTATCTPTGA